jgi:hypothetical protein
MARDFPALRRSQHIPRHVDRQIAAVQHRYLDQNRDLPIGVRGRFASPVECEAARRLQFVIVVLLTFHNLELSLIAIGRGLRLMDTRDDHIRGGDA